MILVIILLIDDNVGNNNNINNVGNMQDIGLRCMHIHGGVELFVFCPYWIVNRTGRLIRYKVCR